jgi:CDGSH-type Zn-finger protein
MIITIKEIEKNMAENATRKESKSGTSSAGRKIVVSKNGPYLVSGNVPLAKEIIITDNDGTPAEWEKGDPFPDQENYALCRCGGSKSKPYCDGTHARIGFNGTETASRKPYLDQAEEFEGPGLNMTDARDLCAGLQFCHRAGGVWGLVEETDDPKIRKIVTEVTGNCASGRLVACKKDSGKPIEPRLEQSIGIVEDPGKGVSGPISVKGGIPVEAADGTEYEVRNRVTLCRCGRSSNKPFCNGTHISIGFSDGDKSIEP